MNKGVEDRAWWIEGAAEVETVERGHIWEGANELIDVPRVVVAADVISVPPLGRVRIRPVVWPSQLKSSEGIKHIKSSFCTRRGKRT